MMWSKVRSGVNGAELEWSRPVAGSPSGTPAAWETFFSTRDLTDDACQREDVPRYQFQKLSVVKKMWSPYTYPEFYSLTPTLPIKYLPQAWELCTGAAHLGMTQKPILVNLLLVTLILPKSRQQW